MKAPTVFLSQNKWLSLIALTAKAVFVETENDYMPRTPNVSQAFVIDYGEAKARRGNRLGGGGQGRTVITCSEIQQVKTHTFCR